MLALNSAGIVAHRPTILVARGELTSASALAGDDFSVRWTGQLLPPESGRYELVVGANDGFRLFLDGRELLDGWQPTSA
jgi:beta-glucosidase